MERNLDSETAIIINDLDSLAHRIEMLQAHPGYTSAMNKVKEARDLMRHARGDIHQTEMKARFDAQDRFQMRQVPPSEPFMKS